MNSDSEIPKIIRDRMPLGILLVFVVASSLLATQVYLSALQRSGLNLAEVMSIPLFAVLFGWISFSFGTATFGFVKTLWDVVKTPKPTAASSRPMSRTAILMPVYNESPQSVFAGLQATIDSLRETGHAESFDVFVLSDTRDPEVWLEEERTWFRVTQQYPDGPAIYYRHRYENQSRKAGNIEDFCKRWGTNYDYMLVLDADSVMSGSTMVEMARRMDADSQLGILQVPPVPVNRISLFARIQQFASRVYGPIFVKGLAGWSQRHGNYWGHNAIIRVKPFADHCRLPILPGKAPLGGEILSHDFVEAALMVRAGWKVEIADDLDGSFEECPTTFLDSVKRDQRWCQGNLQHSRLAACDGFLFCSRMHFGIGIMSYVASLLWITFLLLTLGGALLDGQAPGLVAANESLLLFMISLGMLFAPKLYGLIMILLRPGLTSQFGGSIRLVAGVLLEALLSVLIAPLLALYHSRFVIGILFGRKVEWNTQQRDDCGVSFRAAIAEHWKQTLVGLLISGALIAYLPSLAVWFSPIFIGLAFSIPLAMVLGSPGIGGRLADWGLLLTPDETKPAPVLQRAKELQRAFHQDNRGSHHERLFDLLLHDPEFRRLHLKVLSKTRSSVPANDEQRNRLVAAIETGNAQTVGKEDQFALLSDEETLRSLDRP